MVANSAPQLVGKGHRWKPGESGNPLGRQKVKPLTDTIRAALQKAVNSGDHRKLKSAIKDRLVWIILHGEDKDSMAAIKLLWEYVEGKPQQTIELDFSRAIDDIAARTGAPRTWLVQRSREITARYGTEGIAGMLPPGLIGDDEDEEDEPEAEPVRTGGRVMGVRRTA